jgi:hypothetical protein
MFGTGYQAQSDHEADGACWLEEALRREIAFEEESLRGCVQHQTLIRLIYSRQRTVCNAEHHSIPKPSLGMAQ